MDYELKGLPSTNMFKYATKELSQDAFLCWLLSWADDKHQKSKLNGPARQLLSRLLGEELPEPLKVKVKAQKHRIDILVLINDDKLLLIEDKTFTSDSVNKLKGYIDVAASQYEGRVIHPVYLKLGNQSDTSAVEEAGYTLFTRRDLLDTLQVKKPRKIHDFLADYLEYLTYIDAQYDSYRVLRQEQEKKWTRLTWEGLFHELKKSIPGADYGYVANPQGGFVGCWWSVGDSALYLQLEEKRCCFKVKVTDKSAQTRIRGQYYKRIMERNAEQLPIDRPSRFRSGQHMTVALIEDYRQWNEDGTLDITATVEHLQEISRFAEELVNQKVG